MRRTLLPAAALLAALGCDAADDPVHPSYDPCAAGASCGLGTRCAAVPLRRTPGDAAVSLCTASCGVDHDCPGFDARCVAPPGGAADAGSLCYRGCVTSLDCRGGTACHPLRRDGVRIGVCVPDDGRARCASNADCAPFDEACAIPDAGLGRDAAGTCRTADASAD